MNKKGPISSIIFTPIDDQAPGAGLFQGVDQNSDHSAVANILCPAADADGSVLDEIKGLNFGYVQAVDGTDPFAGLDADGAAALLGIDPTVVPVTLDDKGTVKGVPFEFNSGTTPLALVCWFND